MKFYLKKYFNTGKFVEHAVFDCLSHELVEKLPKGKPLDLKFTINGYDVDVEKFFNHIEKSYEKQVNSTAKGLIKDKYYEEVRTVYEVLNEIENKIKEVATEKLDINFEEY